MNFLEKLDFLLVQRNMNKLQLSKATGIPYTTIDSFYKKGYDNIKLSTLLKLSNYFQCTLDYLVDDNSEEINNITDINANQPQDTTILTELYEVAKSLSETEQLYLLNTIKSLKQLLDEKNKNNP